MKIKAVSSERVSGVQVLLFIMLLTIGVGGLAGMITMIDMSELSTFRAEPTTA